MEEVPGGGIFKGEVGGPRRGDRRVLDPRLCNNFVTLARGGPGGRPAGVSAGQRFFFLPLTVTFLLDVVVSPLTVPLMLTTAFRLPFFASSLRADFESLTLTFFFWPGGTEKLAFPSVSFFFFLLAAAVAFFGTSTFEAVTLVIFPVQLPRAPAGQLIGMSTDLPFTLSTFSARVSPGNRTGVPTAPPGGGAGGFGVTVVPGGTNSYAPMSGAAPIFRAFPSGSVLPLSGLS